MTLPILSVSHLSKRYLVGHEQSRERYSSLRDTIARQARGFARKTRDMLRGRQIIQGDEIEEFWALKDVSFDVQPGEVVGIIGSNGAGKSTLLKILSRISDPTEGRVVLRGRVSSLLEVGTGFHGELSGRENILLNGAILGMTRAEIKGRFEAIVEFAGVEKFLDTPVKRYSSGMYVRLAFAVAAHLDPEILIVDEVLAVGDAEFQKRCLVKMNEVSCSGRTVLLVSHSMPFILRLCRVVVLLANGRVQGIGEPEEMVGRYLKSQQPDSNAASLAGRTDRSGTGVTRIEEVSLLNRLHVPVSGVAINEPLFIRLRYSGKRSLEGAAIYAAIFDASGSPVTFMSSLYSGALPREMPLQGTLICAIKGIPVCPGTYSLSLCLKSNEVEVDHISNAIRFEIIPSQIYESGRLPPAKYGMVLSDYTWRLSLD